VADSAVSGRRLRGPNDPDRRAKIAKAAIEVVAERGVGGLTHRAVAAAADVPLGSTTYHFATLDDLLEVALHEAAENNVRQLRAWEQGLGDRVDFAGALTDLVMGYLDAPNPRTVVEYDLYVAALHRPRLRAASAAWDKALIGLFGSRTDALTGRVLAALFCGLVMQAVLAEPAPARAEIDAIFRRAIEGPPAKRR
jgi:DNA-binding transcriptional regulator YbjK